MRLGQSYMSALFSLNKKLYEEWTAEPWDCFYVDAKCDLFIKILFEHYRKDIKNHQQLADNLKSCKNCRFKKTCQSLDNFCEECELIDDCDSEYCIYD